MPEIKIEMPEVTPDLLAFMTCQAPRSSAWTAECETHCWEAMLAAVVVACCNSPKQGSDYLWIDPNADAAVWQLKRMLSNFPLGLFYVGADCVGVQHRARHIFFRKPDRATNIPVRRIRGCVVAHANALPTLPDLPMRKLWAFGAVPSPNHWFADAPAWGAHYTLDAEQALRRWPNPVLKEKMEKDRTGMTPRTFARRYEAKLLPQSGPLDLEAWGRRYLSHYLTAPCNRMHRWMFEALASLHITRGSRMNVIGPRAGAKSTWPAFAYPLAMICEGLEKYIILLSDTSTQAAGLLRPIRDELETNERIREDYPHVSGVGSVWNEDQVVTRNGILVEALGTGSKIRGRRWGEHRPSLIIGDDLQNDDHIVSKVRRERTASWFDRAVLKAGAPGTNVIVTGTVLHRECLVLNLHRRPGWNTRLFRSILRWPANMDLWRQWEEILQNPDYDNQDAAVRARRFFERNRWAMEAGAEVLWPEREPLYDLMYMRAVEGRLAFESEKQQNPANPDQCEWSEELFDGPGFWFDAWPKGLEIRTMALDPSKGKDARRGDYSAIVKLGRDRTGMLYVEADLQRRDVHKICDDFVETAYQFKPHAAGVETNQFQELLQDDILLEAERRGYLCPVVPLPNHVSKPVRIRRLGPILNLRKARFRAGSIGTKLLVEQLRDFPIGDHDDGPDALEMAARLAAEMYAGTGVEPLVLSPPA